MSVQIITGNIGSGKTRYCIDQMKKRHLENPDRKCIMIVPSHYSHETERMLINEFGGTGLNNIECTTFEKLSRQLVDNPSLPLGASGKQVLICHAVKMCLNELEKQRDKFNSRLVSAVGKSGFTDIVASLIGELHRYNITPQSLREQINNTENELLRQKLTVMLMIFESYARLLDEGSYIDSDEDLMRLVPEIKKHFGSMSDIWINKFDELLPQQATVVKSLIDCGANITITFFVCKDFNDPYYGTKKAIEMLKSYTSVSTLHLEGEFNYIKDAPDLKFLFSSWFDRREYTDKVNNAELFIARDTYSEIEHIACKILDLVRENGYRFHDIGIVCAKSQDYSHIIEAIFDEYEIPYYSDDKIAISEYPIAMQILSLFDIVENNWDYSSMFAYLRSGFIYVKAGNKYKRFDNNDIDLLENFVLQYGINYKSAWCRSWLSKKTGIIETALDKDNRKKKYDIEYIDNLREIIIYPIIQYCDAVKSAKTVSDYCRAMYQFLENINLYQGLKTELLYTAINNATAEAQRFSQIWNLILDTLDQINTALGNNYVTHKEFADYMKTAMTQCEIRTIPSGIDRVFIGSADMNRAIPTRAVFIAGAVSGTFPQCSMKEGFLSNSERELLAENQFTLAPTTIKKSEKLRNTVYKLLSAAWEKLFISYPSMSMDGGTLLPSQIVTDIKNKLKNIPVICEAVNNPNPILYVSSPKATLHKRLISPIEHPLWTHVDAWFNEQKDWKHKLFVINNSRRGFKSRKIELSNELADELYRGKIKYTATRLNAYAQCPFKHYLLFGLGVKEREEYEMNAAETGTYAHELIQRFCKRIDTDPSLDWKSMDEDNCKSVMNSIISDTILRIDDSDLNGKEMAADILTRMGDTVTKAASTLLKSIQCGSFIPCEYEKTISVSLNDNIELGGIIDRLDLCSHNGVNEYRIIDYKTGNKDFKVSEIYNGINMQPVIYALAMRMLDDKATISGMYYSMMHNDYARVGVTSRDTTIASSLAKNPEFHGVSFVGHDMDLPIPEEEINRIENEYSRINNGIFISSKKDEVTYGKSLKTRPQGELLMEMVRDKILSMDKEIRGGNIEISPLSTGSNTPCTFCEFSDACKFDDSVKKNRQAEEKDEQVWEFLEEDR